MKRYITLAFLAVVALTSCKVGDGTEPNPNGSKNILWQRVYSYIYGAYYTGYWAIYGDAILSGDEQLLTIVENNRLADIDNVEVTDDEIILRENILYSDRSYRIVTRGKKLSEGGIWQLYIDITNIHGSKSQLLATFNGKEGQERTFSVKNIGETSEITSLFSYNCTEENTISVTHSCSGKEEEDSYAINFVTNPQLPVVFKNGKIADGEVEITYTDKEISSIRKFTTQIVGESESAYSILDNVIYK